MVIHFCYVYVKVILQRICHYHTMPIAHLDKNNTYSKIWGFQIMCKFTVVGNAINSTQENTLILNCLNSTCYFPNHTILFQDNTNIFIDKHGVQKHVAFAAMKTVCRLTYLPSRLFYTTRRKTAFTPKQKYTHHEKQTLRQNTPCR